MYSNKNRQGNLAKPTLPDLPQRSWKTRQLESCYFILFSSFWNSDVSFPVSVPYKIIHRWKSFFMLQGTSKSADIDCHKFLYIINLYKLSHLLINVLSILVMYILGYNFKLCSLLHRVRHSHLFQLTIYYRTISTI